MKEADQKAVELYKAKAEELIDKTAGSLTITTPEQNVLVIERKAKLNKLGKEVKAEKEKATKPLNEALRTVRSWWAPLEEMIEEGEKIFSRALLTYKSKVEEEARKKEAQIAARVEKGTMRLDTAERKLEQVQHVEKHADTEFGRVQFRKVKRVRITNPDLVPDEYWIIDQVKLNEAVLRQGIQVLGTEIFEEERD